MFTRILVPTDFSAPSDAALAHAREIAERFGAAIQVLHVVEDEVVTGPLGAEMYVPHTAGTATRLLEIGRARLAEWLSGQDRSGLRFTADAIVGPAARTIADYARDNGYDLIVMGTHGRNGVAHLLMGSVAEHVLRAASCPVLTVREAPARMALPIPARRPTATA